MPKTLKGPKQLKLKSSKHILPFDAQHAIIQKIDRRLKSLVTKPKMWGDLEAVELQMLLLLEIRWIVLNPKAPNGKERFVQRRWVQFIRANYPQALPGTLAQWIMDCGSDEDEVEFAKTLQTFIKEIVCQMAPK